MRGRLGEREAGKEGEREENRDAWTEGGQERTTEASVGHLGGRKKRGIRRHP